MDATKDGRRYLRREYPDARSVGAVVFVWLLFLILALYVIGLETWVRGRATVFVTVFALTIAICGWQALRKHGVPYNILFAGLCVLIFAMGFGWLMAEAGFKHPAAVVIQVAVLYVFNPWSLRWVCRQYHVRDPDPDR